MEHSRRHLNLQRDVVPSNCKVLPTSLYYVCIYVCMYVCMYVYIYIYIERERDVLLLLTITSVTTTMNDYYYDFKRRRQVAAAAAPAPMGSRPGMAMPTAPTAASKAAEDESSLQTRSVKR